MQRARFAIAVPPAAGQAFELGDFGRIDVVRAHRLMPWRCDRASAGSWLDEFGQVDTGQHAIAQFAHAGDPDVADLLATGRIDQLRNHVVDRLAFRSRRGAPRSGRPACRLRSSRCDRSSPAPRADRGRRAQRAGRIERARRRWRRACRAARRCAFRRTCRDRCSMAQPSVPSARLTPARRIASAGQNPLAVSCSIRRCARSTRRASRTRRSRLRSAGSCARRSGDR